MVRRIHFYLTALLCTTAVYIQDLVYKLSEVGQAIEKNDLSAASSVLGPSKDTEWFQKANSALNKVYYFIPCTTRLLELVKPIYL